MVEELRGKYMKKQAFGIIDLKQYRHAKISMEKIFSTLRWI